MTRLLRGIKGPYAGAVFVIGERVSLGRASDSDIQILHPEVSRHHAKIVRSPAGETVLVDLASDHGTSVNDIRIDRYVLRPGDSFCIHKCIFMFEEVQAPVETSAVFDARIHSMESMRPTLVMRPLDPRAAGVRPREYQPLGGTSWSPPPDATRDVVVMADIERDGWSPTRETVNVDRLEQLPPFPPLAQVELEPFTLEMVEDEWETHVVSPMEFEVLNDEMSFEIVFEGDEPERHELLPTEDSVSVPPREPELAAGSKDDPAPVSDPSPIREPALTRVELGAWGWIHEQEAMLAGGGEARATRALVTTATRRDRDDAAPKSERSGAQEGAERQAPVLLHGASSRPMKSVSGDGEGLGAWPQPAAAASPGEHSGMAGGRTRRPRGGRSSSAPRWQPSGVLDVDAAQQGGNTWTEGPTPDWALDGDADEDTLRVSRSSMSDLGDDGADEQTPARTAQAVSKDAGLLLCSDISEFRCLRARKVQLGGLPTVDELRLATLQARLHAWAEGRSVERHYRPEGWTAQGCLLRWHEGRRVQVDVRVRDLSVNGVRLIGDVTRVAIGDALWFALDVSGVHAAPRHLAFKARVAWMFGEQRCVGLLFVGPARYVEHPDDALPHWSN